MLRENFLKLIRTLQLVQQLCRTHYLNTAHWTFSVITKLPISVKRNVLRALQYFWSIRLSIIKIRMVERLLNVYSNYERILIQGILRQRSVPIAYHVRIISASECWMIVVKLRPQQICRHTCSFACTKMFRKFRVIICSHIVEERKIRIQSIFL